MFSENGQVIDQTISGGVEHDFYDYCDGKHYVAVYKLKELSDEQRDKLLSGMKSLLGPGYGWFQALVMFSRIILGAQDRYRISFTLDLLFVLVPLWMLGAWRHLCFQFATASFWIYLGIVLTNMLIRLAREDPRLRIVV
jgi:hypothetical protein